MIFLLKETDIREINESPVSLIGDNWALITAGNSEKFNTMTVSWGALGVLWGKPAAFVFIRPQRYTFEFFEKEEFFTVNLMGTENRDILTFCGRNSGRDCDKIEKTGLKPIYLENGVTFEQAEYTLLCRKSAAQDIDPKGFIDPSIESNYSNKDYHRMYIGEIVKVFKKS